MDVTSETPSGDPAPAPTVAPSAAGEETAGFLPTQMEDGAKFEALQKAFQDAGECLDVGFPALDPQEQVSRDLVVNSLSSSFGQMSATLPEWETTDLRTPEGELRRLHVSYIEDPVTLERVKKLEYISYAGGQERPLPLTPEQEKNPSDSLISSLQADGQLVSSARSQKIYFSTGDTISTVENNGQLDSLVLIRQGISATCSGLATANAKCVCSAKRFEP